MKLDEDERYRRTSQFKDWSYTPQALQDLRTATNEAAAGRVRAAFKRIRDREAKAAAAAAHTDDGAHIEPVAKEVECLTLEEERKLVDYYCAQCLRQGKEHFRFPDQVYATAVQYMRRFYLFNSPMTYHPKEILKTVLFLATKVENFHQNLDEYCSKVPGKKATQREAVLAPEFIVMQALRYSFEVYHPFRGLIGGFLELLALCKGNAEAISAKSSSQKTSAQLQREMLNLPREAGGAPVAHEQSKMEDRINYARSVAQDKYLRRAALLTDAYFQYTPSQIWLAALLLVDEPVTLFYLSAKFPDAPESTPAGILKARVISTIRACADMLAAGEATGQPTPDEIAELTRVDKKLYQCRNPEKTDLIELNKAKKRDAMTDGKLDEKIVKKRKQERSESDDVFGGPLKPAGA